jgi:hypothetical protein
MPHALLPVDGPLAGHRRFRRAGERAVVERAFFHLFSPFCARERGSTHPSKP